MQEELVSLETAKLAKEAGFDWPVQDRYRVISGLPDLVLNENGHRRYGGVSNWNHECFQDQYRMYTSAPTLGLLQKWLKETYNVDIVIEPYINTHVEYSYTPAIITLAPNKLSLEALEITGYFDTYKEALNIACKEFLKIHLKSLAG
jgi:hypothetical protein